MRENTQALNSANVVRNIGVLVPTILVIFIGQISSMSNLSRVLLADLGIVGIIALILPEKNILPFMLCMIAPNRILTYGSISAPTIIMLVGILRNMKLACKFEKRFLVSVLGLFGISVFTGLFGKEMILDAIKIVVVLIFLRIYTDCDNIRQSYIRYIQYCALGCVLSGVISLVINPNSISDAGRFSLSGSGENVLGILCAVLVLHLVTIAIDDHQVRKGFLFIYCVFLIGIGFLTGSRSFFLAIAVGLLFLFFTIVVKLNIRAFAKMLIICIFAIILFYILYNYNGFINNYLSKILYRINKLKNTDVSNGRFTLWTQYINVLSNNTVHLLFGGMKPSDFGIKKVAHNMIIEQIVSFGIVGSCFIISAYSCMFKYLQRRSESIIKLISVNMAPIVALLGASMVSHTLLGVPQTIMLYLGVIGLYEQNNMEVSR